MREAFLFAFPPCHFATSQSATIALSARRRRRWTAPPQSSGEEVRGIDGPPAVDEIRCSGPLGYELMSNSQPLAFSPRRRRPSFAKAKPSKSEGAGKTGHRLVPMVRVQ
jgi:hypothetical protein